MSTASIGFHLNVADEPELHAFRDETGAYHLRISVGLNDVFFAATDPAQIEAVLWSAIHTLDAVVAAETARLTAIGETFRVADITGDDATAFPACGHNGACGCACEASR